MQERTKHFYIWTAVAVAGAMFGLLVFIKLGDFKRTEDVSLMEVLLSKINRTDKVLGLETYNSQAKGFSFKYPDKLSLIEIGNATELSHQIPFKNHGDCDMKGDEKTYDNLTDFKATLQIMDGTVAQAVKKISPYMPAENFQGDTLKISPGFIDSYQAGNLSGFAIYEGVEGCGHTIYYFPIGSNRVLVVENAMVQVLSGISDLENQVLAVPGVISRDENAQIFRQILESIRILPPQDMGRGGLPSEALAQEGGEVDTTNWKTYRNEEYGFEFKYPSDLSYKEFSDALSNKAKPLKINFGNQTDTQKLSLNINETFGLEGCDQESSKETRVIDNINMLREDLCGQILYSFKKSNNDFVFINWSYNIQKFDQILSTFEFIK